MPKLPYPDSNQYPNRGPEEKRCTYYQHSGFVITGLGAMTMKTLLKVATNNDFSVIEASHPTLGELWLYCEAQLNCYLQKMKPTLERLFG